MNQFWDSSALPRDRPVWLEAGGCMAPQWARLRLPSTWQRVRRIASAWLSDPGHPAIAMSYDRVPVCSCRRRTVGWSPGPRLVSGDGGAGLPRGGAVAGEWPGQPELGMAGGDQPWPGQAAATSPIWRWPEDLGNIAGCAGCGAIHAPGRRWCAGDVSLGPWRRDRSGDHPCWVMCAPPWRRRIRAIRGKRENSGRV
jgi:hypothetical protein